MNSLKISVSLNGEIMVCDKASSLKDLKQSKGMVLYHRPNPTDPPHPVARKVIELIIQNSLPIRLCVNPDFTN